MVKKRATKKKAKTPRKPKTVENTAKKPRPQTTRSKPTKKTKAKKPMPAAVKAVNEALPDLKKFDKIKTMLGKLSEEDLNNLWLGTYGYGDEITEADLPDNQTVIDQLADRAMELQPTKEEMTPKGLSNLIDDAS